MATRFCSTCTKKDTCKEICQPLENYLARKESDKELLNIDRLYTDNWIRQKEVPYDPAHFEQFLPFECFKKMWGKEVREVEHYDENAEK